MSIRLKGKIRSVNFEALLKYVGHTDSVDLSKEETVGKYVYSVLMCHYQK